MDISCAVCKTRFGNLRRCSKCFKVYYCSKTCQILDWKCGHRMMCRTYSKVGKDKKLFSKEDVCSVCSRKCNTRRCSKCHKVRYCSEKCQKRDWPDHRLLCTSADSFDRDQLSDVTKKLQAKINEVDGKGPETGDQKSTLEPGNLPNRKCAVCGVSGTKSCGRCKNVSYCSKACQRKDWSSHKSNCKSDVDDIITTDGYKKIQEEEKRAREHNIRPIDFLRMGFGFPPFFVSDNADLRMRKTATASLKRKAKLVAQSLFWGQTVVDNFDEVPTEPWGMFLTEGVVLVGFISRYHPYRGRHCVYVEDIDGAELYVGFYFDHPPFPYFTWGSVRPGRFICILEPCVHFFMDGSVGFRIDSPREVKFIDP